MGAAGEQGAPAPQLPLHLVMCVLKHLPPGAQAWAGRGVCREAATLLSCATRISARDPDLPGWVLAAWFERATACERARLLEARAGAGDLAGCQLLRSLGCPWSSAACCAAAEAGHLRLLQWLRAPRPLPCPLNASLCALAAAAAGQLHVLQWLAAEYALAPFDLALLVEAAAATNQAPLLSWLISLAPPGSPLARAPAAAASEASASAQRQQMQQALCFARARTPRAVLGRA